MDVKEVEYLVASGKKTDADATDRTIDTEGFYHIMLDCSDSTSEMTFTIDESISGAEKPIYVKSSGTLDLKSYGKVLHYSGGGTFLYVLTN